MTDHLAFEVKFTALDDAGEFDGLRVASSVETDLIGDMVAPGAFRKAAART